MPPHRKEWAGAILNELAYIASRRARVHWIIGAMLSAIGARISYQLEQTFMNLRILKAALILVTMAVGLAAATYAIQKPYQQERIKIAVQRLWNAQQT